MIRAVNGGFESSREREDFLGYPVLLKESMTFEKNSLTEIFLGLEIDREAILFNFNAKPDLNRLVFIPGYFDSQYYIKFYPTIIDGLIIHEARFSTSTEGELSVFARHILNLEKLQSSTVNTEIDGTGIGTGTNTTTIEGDKFIISENDKIILNRGFNLGRLVLERNEMFLFNAIKTEDRKIY